MALSDKALSVFAFAAYHQLESGQKVSAVIRQDGAGHEADPDGVKELEEADLIEVTEKEIVFKEAGLPKVEAAIAAIRQAVG